MDSFFSFLPGIAASVGILAGGMAAFVTWRKSTRNADIAMSIRRGSVQIEFTVKGNAEEARRVVNEILSSLDQEDHVSVGAAGISEEDIVRTFREIERAANDLINASTEAPEARRGIFQLRKSLRDLGIWSDDEVAKFDNIARLRNASVHGDTGTKKSAAEIRAIISDAEDLLSSLRRRTGTTQVDEGRRE